MSIVTFPYTFHHILDKYFSLFFPVPPPSNPAPPLPKGCEGSPDPEVIGVMPVLLQSGYLDI